MMVIPLAKETIMEGRIFALLYSLVTTIGNTHSRKGKRFSDSAIVLIHLWAALWDRPISWACRTENWPVSLPWRGLPTPSTMSRRLRTIGVLTLLEQARSALRQRFPDGIFKWIDGKPLPVGFYSKDRDARWGHAAGTEARGYKIHAIIDSHGAVDHWTLGGMNRRESALAPDILNRLEGGGYVVGDNAYDSNRLYDLAGRRNYQLVAPSRPSASGLGKIRHSPQRLRGLSLLKSPVAGGAFGQGLLDSRDGIERRFGQWGNFGGGLSPLPNWVRGPRRVALWVQAKLLICAARDLIKNKDLS
jgi:hypothetical protein